MNSELLHPIIAQPEPVESAGPGLMAWTIFPFLIYQCNLKATVYAGLQPRNESRIGRFQ